MNKTAIVENQTKDNATSSKSTKRVREDKPRKKDEKSLENVFRALDSFGNTEQKLGAMYQKYAEMYNDQRMLQTAVKQAEKKNTVLQKEKEQLQSEHSKAILTRSRLENLCRELQRQNKAVKEECMLKMREEGEKKREVAAKFHSMLSEIGSLLAQNNNKNAKLRDDNLDMSMRLKSVCDQFEKKEQHVENLAKQMELEMQLSDAKLAKAKMEMDIEKETLEKEKQQLVIDLAEYKRKIIEMKASELTLREQITMYSEKYEEFHKALLQSNSAIGDFKAEMERMSKHIRRLEKETATWKARYDAAQRTIADVSQGKLRSDEALALSQRRLAALKGICRGLQEQCKQLRGEQRRDSQTDEEFRKLEEQIKEVEKSTEIDLEPCPRKVSSEALKEIEPAEDSVIVNGSELETRSENCESVVEIVNAENLPEESDKLAENVGNCETIVNGVHTDSQSPKPGCNQSSNPIVTNETDTSNTSQINNLPPSEPGVKVSIEDCVNSLVNHIQEVSLIDVKSDLDLSNGDKMPEETERSKTETDVPKAQNPIVQSEEIQGSSNTESIEKSTNTNGSILHDLSKLPNGEGHPLTTQQSISNGKCDLSSDNMDINSEKDTNNPEELNQTKNKKKRKSKNK